MSDVMIRVENLSKVYRIGKTEAAPTSRGAGLVALAGKPFGYLRQMLTPPTDQEILWALKNISFEVERGQVLGVIGKNGAGKSTLLKILARITDPSAGRAVLHGRMGSLLEVGTGFHPELTGRENIYLSGTILGMKKFEIDRRLDEIVEFSGVERFLDTPIKRYSSGMIVRLAFSVAAHLDPEILLIDEVLAVGDLAFQRKCMGKMNQVAREGRTILFVSHSMPSVQALCQRVVLLEGGMITHDGSPTAVVNQYEDQETVLGSGSVDLANHPNRVTRQRFFTSLNLCNEKNIQTSRFRLGEKITFELKLDLQEEMLTDPFIAISIERHGQAICVLTTHFMYNEVVTVSGACTIRCEWDLGWLAPGTYLLDRVSLKKYSGGERLDQITNVASFEIFPTDVYGTGKVIFSDGIIVPKAVWEIESTRQPSDLAHSFA